MCSIDPGQSRSVIGGSTQRRFQKIFEEGPPIVANPVTSLPLSSIERSHTSWAERLEPTEWPSVQEPAAWSFDSGMCWPRFREMEKSAMRLTKLVGYRTASQPLEVPHWVQTILVSTSCCHSHRHSFAPPACKTVLERWCGNSRVPVQPGSTVNPQHSRYSLRSHR